MRVGQKTSRTRVWARRGTRPRQVCDLRTGCAYLFGAICPERATGAAIVMQRANTHAMQAHLDEISLAVAPGAHAVLVLDQAGWHTTKKLDLPDNITLVPLPPRSPELNPAENIWQYLRQRWLSNHIFNDYDAILDAVCDAWNRLIDEPERIKSIGSRPWAMSGQP
jgi:transposase